MKAAEKRALMEPADQDVSHPPVHDIRDLISFRLSNLVAANDRVGQGWVQKKFGLSLNEWRVLGLTHALEPVIVSDIRRILHIDKGQLSRVVKSLIERGFLRGTANRDDQRFIELQVTTRGRALHDDMLAYSTQRNRNVIADLSKQEARELFRLLGKLRSGIEQRLALLEDGQ